LINLECLLKISNEFKTNKIIEDFTFLYAKFTHINGYYYEIWERAGLVQI